VLGLRCSQRFSIWRLCREPLKIVLEKNSINKNVMYKQSCYNYFVNDTGQVIYLNGISGISFSVKEDEDKKLQSLFCDLTHFKRNYPLFFNKLIEWGFVIDENKNEIDTLKAKHRIVAIENRDYQIMIINPTQECNFVGGKLCHNFYL
jgi:hypothetical protein